MTAWRHLFPIWPPSTNKIWRYERGVVHLSDAAKAFRRAVADEIFIRRAQKALPARMLASDLAVTLKLYPPDNYRRDIDNPLKSVLDAMTAAGLWWDDSRIKRLLVTMEPPDPERRGKFWIEVEELPTAQRPNKRPARNKKKGSGAP